MNEMARLEEIEKRLIQMFFKTIDLYGSGYLDITESEEYENLLSKAKGKRTKILIDRQY